MNMQQDSIHLAAERQERIHALITERGTLRVDELADILSVSLATIRRDLLELDRRGLVKRVHGGAMSVRNRVVEPMFDDKTSIASAEKQAIAAAAYHDIESSDTIFLDGGSTILALARLLQGRDDVKVVTNSLRVATLLAGGGPRLILIGGQLRHLSQTFVGPLTEPILSELHVDKAFMGTIGLSLDAGLTTTDADEAFTKKRVMRCANRVLLLADASKIGKVAFAHAGDIADLDVLITDDGIDQPTRESIENNHVDIICVTPGTPHRTPRQTAINHLAQPA
ncbi:MAG: DeoR family fructose operon transcriptional repressor [Candidatus Promineifilaceae bacterium]|jgi:DeoR family transcriptional regulator, fructose operon transcriptional repressor